MMADMGRHDFNHESLLPKKSWYN